MPSIVLFIAPSWSRPVCTWVQPPGLSLIPFLLGLAADRLDEHAEPAIGRGGERGMVEIERLIALRVDHDRHARAADIGAELDLGPAPVLPARAERLVIDGGNVV